MTTTHYEIEWMFAGQWCRLARYSTTLKAAREYAHTVFLPPTRAEARPKRRIVEVTRTERIVR